MKLILLLVLFCVVFANERLIRFNETFALWLTESDVLKLSESSPPIHFMDITEYPELTNVNKKAFFIPVNPRYPTIVRPRLNAVRGSIILSEIEKLASYATRYYTSPTGIAAAEYLQAQYEIHALNNGRSDVEVDLWYHNAWPNGQPSVIARIPGSSRPSEIVVIGGHIDSTASGSVAPGADDDASGSSTVMEVFRVLVSSGFRPERTIEFHGYSAEEVGLRGSQDIANTYANQGKDVVAMLQFDMTGYLRPNFTPTIGVITDFTDSTLTQFIRRLVEVYINDHDSRTWTNTACGYACSDHASWYRAGYVDAFVFEASFSNSNPYIHTANDLPSRLSVPHMEIFGKLGVAYAIELSYTE
jgi:leucyl aminopeptidase